MQAATNATADTTLTTRSTRSTIHYQSDPDGRLTQAGPGSGRDRGSTDRTGEATEEVAGAMDLVTDVFEATSRFPAHERFGLSAQMRRSAVSIASNIAEGHSRHSTAEYLHLLSVADGSLAELTTQLEIAERVHFLPRALHESTAAKAAEIGRMLFGLRRALRRLSSSSPAP